MNKIFPIKVEPACLLKWSWSTVYFNSGTSSSCHRTQKHAIDPSNFNSFHNLPEKIQEREKMLSGHWPDIGCESCQRVEEAGGTSDRQHQLELQKDSCMHPPELDSDPTATSVTPTILEVYFTNTCNMSCVYCGPHFSSLWEDENRRFSSAFTDKNNSSIFSIRNSQNNDHYDQMVKDFWNYLKTDNRHLVLKRFHVLGGEPFLLKELDDVINFWDQYPNQDLVISIITNLNIPTARFKSYMTKFKKLVEENKIWKIQITASLDAWGKQQEYTRYGLNLKLWQENFEFLIDKPWVTLSVNSAVSALTLKQMPTLIEKINYWDSLRPAGCESIYHSFHPTGEYDDPYIFGDAFNNEFEKIISVMSSESATYSQMKSLAKAVNKFQPNTTKIQALKDYLDKLDQRRKTDWRKVFPWLDKDF
jgi:organic radical activating enzyme